MTEHLLIHKKDVWIKVDPWHVKRSNPGIIPTEYFTAVYFLKEPLPDAAHGETIKDEHGEPKLFESPVAALSYTEKKLEELL